MQFGKTEQDQLIEAALEARKNAYAPYSKYLVGAALLGSNGKIYTGVNIENASYGLTNCAERTAIATAVTCGEQTFLGMAIAIKGKGSPCGACRQVIAEFCKDLPILIIDTEHPTKVVITSLEELLPNAFRFEE